MKTYFYVQIPHQVLAVFLVAPEHMVSDSDTAAVEETMATSVTERRALPAGQLNENTFQ